MSDQNTNKDYIKNLLEDVQYIKDNLPNGKLDELTRSIETLSKNQSEMNNTLMEIHEVVMDPVNGLIVKVNRNTEFRENKKAEQEKMDEVLQEHRDLVQYKKNVNRVLWIIITVLAGIVLKMIFIG